MYLAFKNLKISSEKVQKLPKTLRQSTNDVFRALNFNKTGAADAIRTSTAKKQNK